MSYFLRKYTQRALETFSVGFGAGLGFIAALKIAGLLGGVL